MVRDFIAERSGRDDADQTAVLLIAFEVDVFQSDHIPPRHDRMKANRRGIESHPDIRPPFFGFWDVDQNRLGRHGAARNGSQPFGQANLYVPPGSGIEVEVAEPAVELGGTGTDLDRLLVEAALT